MFLFASVTVLSYAFVAFLIRWTQQRRMLDIPNERSSHERPTPRGGGLAIGTLTLVGSTLYAAMHLNAAPVSAFAYLLCGLIVMILGLVDDVHSLPSSQRLFIQGAAAAGFIVVVGSWRIIEIPFLGLIDTGLLGPLLALIWLVGLINAFNFMDGIDGIAGGVAVTAALGWAAMASTELSAEFVRLVALLIAGSSLGFLGHNWSPARIFMGDGGSTFLGFSFAALPLLLNPENPRLPVAGALLVWPFLFDTVLTILVRLKRRENILAAHRSHLYQRLVIKGYSHQNVSLLYIFFAITGLITAWLWMAEAPIAPVLIVFLLPLIWLIYAGFVVLKFLQKA
jgi:UDP-N-acetylmuramyl pentapeptide phosphotransferase/UDP-N-acetylglucosamine-1-phosphate transferase